MAKKDHEDDLCVRHPMALRYMKTLRSLLDVVNCWPYHVFGERIKPLPFRSTYFLFPAWLVFFITSIVYIKAHYQTSTFYEMGQTYLTVLFLIIALQRVTIPWFKMYGQVIEEFIVEIHLFHHKQKSEFSEYIYLKINKICAVFVQLLRTITLLGIIFFNLMPIYFNFLKGKFSGDGAPDKAFEHSINYSLPYINSETDIVGYFVVAILNLFLSYDIRTCFCAFDLILCIIVFHIWGHLKILDHNLRSLPKPREMRNQPSGLSQDEMSYNKEENKKIAQLLKDIVDHHRLIMNFMKKTSDAFGPMLCLYFSFHRVSGCMLLLECSKLDAQSLGQYACLTLTVFQLMIEVSIIVELLGSQSETLKDAVYGVPWECMDTRNRKLVVFILCNSQEPIYLKPMGLISVGVQTMASILKMSISYFMFIRTFA